MASRRIDTKKQEATRRRRATTPESRENQLIALAVDTVERKMLDGTASSQEITHFLKLASSRERLEQEKLAKELELLDAKRELMQKTDRMEQLMTDAVEAFKSYSGNAADVPLDDYDER